jgi:hypothetical protein
VQIEEYEFEGPYTHTSSLKDDGGLYVLLDRRADGNWYVVDVGESGQIKTRIEGHDRRDSWLRVRTGILGVAVLYTPGWTPDQRRVLERAVRSRYEPACGHV